MSDWPESPKLYEINTWVWLAALSRRYGSAIDLSSVPAAEWDAIAEFRMDAVWLMGMWERSAAGIAIANQNHGLLEDFRRALPDFQIEDNVGSAYCIRRYVVDERLGGPQGLAIARKELAQRGMRLILDFVPNHVAPDHPWVTAHPEYFVQGSGEDLRDDPASFLEVEGRIYARGRDPNFPAWPDVLQLNAFAPELRLAIARELSKIADQCDGVRCDMAMLVMSGIFARTWGAGAEGGRAGRVPDTEYWVEVIPAVKRTHPGFLFIAEAYWELEWDLQQQGFDYCYDKRLYDRLEHGSPESIRLHLSADMAYQRKLLRFIENHDEPRAAAIFSPERERAATVTMATLPGAKLFHEGQFEGRKTRVPVFLGRGPEEAPNEWLQDFYRRLMKAIDSPAYRRGEWSLCACIGWPDNASFQNLAAWSWVAADDEADDLAGDLAQDRWLVVVNLSGTAVQARVEVPMGEEQGGAVYLEDALSDVVYERDAGEMLDPGLYVDMGPWECYCFHVRPANPA
jgi:hypothetical protein